MATVTQNVIIDFQADFTSVQDGVDILEKMGKVDKDLADQFRKTNTEIKKQGDAIDQTAKKSQTGVQSFGKLADLMKQFPKSGLNRFLLQIGDELAKAGFQAKDFYQKLDPKDAVTKQTTLRNELRQVKEQMQAAALAGGTLGEEYQRLKKRAGELDDTIRDVANDIKNAGSDTRGIDNVVGSISALAGGYSAVQGAAALFGEESEDLQRALLKVNAAMALATGIQQVSNALQKEGSLVRLADAAATGVQIAVQKVYTFVTGRATAATFLFKAALAATGIGAVILLIVALSNAFKKTNKDLEKATANTELYAKELESLNLLLQQNLSIDLARAERLGASESELISIRGKSLLKERAAIVERNKDLVLQRDALKGTSRAYGVLNNAIEENNKNLTGVDTELIVANFNLQKSLLNERLALIDQLEKVQSASAKNEKERFAISIKFERQRLAELVASNAGALEISKKEADIAAALAKRKIDIANRQREALLQIQQGETDLKLIMVREGTQEEFDLSNKLLGQQRDAELENEDLTTNERLLIIQNFLKQKTELEKKFNRSSSIQGIEDEKSRVSAILSNLNLLESEKLDLRIEFLKLSSGAEVIEANGNAAKIKEINRKLNAAITAEKIESIRKIANDELALSNATNGTLKRALESVANDERRIGDEKIIQTRYSAEVRINAIRQLADIETAAIDRQIKANRDAAAIQGADQKSLQIEYEQLLDQKAAASGATEKKITDINAAENAKRQANDIAYIQAAVSGLQSLADILGSIQANDQAAADDAIKRKRKEVEEMLEAGAITEKQARERNRRLDAEERQAKNRAAQQQKNLAVFQALLAIPQAYIAGLTAPFPIGGPIYGAILAGIAAAQAAIVASRPIPKFATGKKGSYSGLAEVGEVGAELIQRADGSMQVATRRSMVYLGARDKVFTAGETKRMMPFVNKEAISATAKGFEFDYNKMAKAVNHKGNSTVVNIDKEFISESVASGLSRVNYFDRYYNSKG